MARNRSAVSERNQPQRIPLALRQPKTNASTTLYQWRWPNGFLCPHCGHDRFCQLSSGKLQQCNRCHRQTSITAGTIFDSTKLPLTVWFQAIYLMTQDKKGVSAMKLHRHLGISYNAALAHQIHKLMQVKMERDREHPLSGWIQTRRRRISVASEVGASAVAARPARRPLSPPWRPTSRDTRCA